MKVRVIKNKAHDDSRGQFLRIFDQNHYGIKNTKLEQVNISYNSKSQTLRGMHFQISGPVEHKFITVISGSIYLVASNAHSVLQKASVRNECFYLSQESQVTLLVPSGLATGWISLSENVVISYLMTSRFQDCSYSGFRFNDSFADISWPVLPKIISDRDLCWPLLR